MNPEHRPEHRFPDFLGIGANRGGSSWLYRVLAHHPQLWLRDYLTGDAFRTSGDGLFANLAWDAHYLFVPESPAWYVDLFRPHHGQITGEVTPAYAILDEPAVREIQTQNPKLKALFLLRNPLDRGWSSLVNNLAKKQRRNIREAELPEMYRRIDASGFQLRSDYARTIRIWTGVFGPAAALHRLHGTDPRPTGRAVAARLRLSGHRSRIAVGGSPAQRRRQHHAQVQRAYARGGAPLHGPEFATPDRGHPPPARQPLHRRLARTGARRAALGYTIG